MMEDWEEIRRQYGPIVWATVFRILRNRDQALDCCQEVFLEAFERSEEDVVRDWPAFLRWLAVRRALDRLRRVRRAAAHLSPDCDIATRARGPVPSEEAEFRELVERVRLETAKLPKRQAEAFWLCCVEETSYDEAAKQMNTDANCIGVLIHRARSRLRELLADLNPTRIDY
ncbi:MAG: sigma-70 family RNA polymerase sigma factor [Planctomycetes bacterium]|nr:sigma-70 family RNA polymerase sigma factor [Planctomycetota bacterium]